VAPILSFERSLYNVVWRLLVTPPSGPFLSFQRLTFPHFTFSPEGVPLWRICPLCIASISHSHPVWFPSSCNFPQYVEFFLIDCSAKPSKCSSVFFPLPSPFFHRRVHAPLILETVKAFYFSSLLSMIPPLFSQPVIDLIQFHAFFKNSPREVFLIKRMQIKQFAIWNPAFSTLLALI